MEERRTIRILIWLMTPKVGFTLLLLLGLLLSPFVYRASRIAGLPDIGHPFDIEEFGTIDLPDEENAFIHYRQALDLKVPSQVVSIDWEHVEEIHADGWEVANEVVQQWLADNRPALAEWLRGTEKTQGFQQHPKDLTFETLLPVTEEMREFARLARLESLRLISLGELDEAWRWQRAMFRSSRHSGQNGGCLIERLVGMALHSISAAQIVHWAEHRNVTAEQLRTALEQLDEDYLLTVAETEPLKAEYTSFLNSLALLNAKRSSLLGYLLHEPTMSLRVYQHCFANMLAGLEKPRRDRTDFHGGDLPLYEVDPHTPRSTNELPPDQIEHYFQNSLLAKLLFPALRQYDIAITEEAAWQVILVTALACQLHFREQGEFPERLEELVDRDYLDKIPDDPFSPNPAPLRYRRNEDGSAVVWSLGRNQTDNGGNIDNDRREGDMGYRLQVSQ